MPPAHVVGWGTEEESRLRTQSSYEGETGCPLLQEEAPSLVSKIIRKLVLYSGEVTYFYLSGAFTLQISLKRSLGTKSSQCLSPKM